MSRISRKLSLTPPPLMRKCLLFAVLLPTCTGLNSAVNEGAPRDTKYNNFCAEPFSSHATHHPLTRQDTLLLLLGLMQVKSRIKGAKQLCFQVPWHRLLQTARSSSRDGPSGGSKVPVAAEHGERGHGRVGGLTQAVSAVIAAAVLGVILRHLRRRAPAQAAPSAVAPVEVGREEVQAMPSSLPGCTNTCFIASVSVQSHRPTGESHLLCC